jgi:DNA polymerase-1
MGPGGTEDSTGLPFCGEPSGTILHRLLVDSGLSESKWHPFKPATIEDNEWVFPVNVKGKQRFVSHKPYILIDNIVRCQPPGNREPDMKEMEHCYKHTKTLLERMPNLKVIIACGRPSQEFFTGSRKITKFRGYPYEWNGYVVIPIVHPRFISNQWQYFDITLYDLEKAGRLAREGWQLPVTNYMEAHQAPKQEILDRLQHIYAFDIETAGMEEKDALDPVRGVITGMACSPKKGEAIHFDFSIPYEKELAKEVLENDAYKIAHNATFDVTFLKRLNINVYSHFDTSLAQHNLVPHWPKSLAFCNSLHTDYPYYKHMRTASQREARITYCCFDADTTFQNYEVMLRETREESLQPVLDEIVYPLVDVCSDMTLTGIRVDEKALDENIKKIDEEADAIWNQFDGYGINIRSHVQLKQLFLSLGLGRLPSTDEDHLKRLCKDIKNNGTQEEKNSLPIIETVLHYRKLNTAQKNFKTIKRNVLKGRIHARFSPAGTETGRLSSEKPAIYNITESRRNIFIPDEGKVFLIADYDRVEFAVAAVLADDKQMIHDAFHRHIHKEVTASLHGPNFTQDQYLEGKGVVFGLIYGRTVGSIALKFGIPKWQAKKYVDIVLGRYPGLARWRTETQTKAKKDGFLHSTFGRIRYFLRGNISGQSLNFPVQSAAADITLQALIRLHKSLKKDPAAELLLSVHDSIMIQCPPTRVNDYMKIMKDIMEQPVPQLNNYSFKVSFKQGNNWRDMEEVEYV